MSRSQIQKFIKEHVLVNGIVKKGNYKIEKNDLIETSFPEISNEIKAEKGELDIRYEDEDILIIFKPKGMIVHPTDSVRSNTVVNRLLYSYKELSKLSGEERPGIVHRLDKDTTGLLIIAKNDEIHEALQKLFKEHKIEKIYYALCYGVFKNKQGVYNESIGRNPSRRTEMMVNGENSREAQTRYEVVWESDKFSLVKIYLDTGRTHQIRVHLKYHHHPIVGDPVYGIKKEKLNINSQMLSACELKFNHPKSGKEIHIVTQPDEEFRKTLIKLKGL